MEKIKCTIKRITYQTPENGYSVLQANIKGYREEQTLVGTFHEVTVGAVLTVEGTWRVDKKYGRQFAVEKWTEELPADIVGIEKYLGSGLVKGIGPKFAKLIVAKFGLDTSIGRVQTPTLALIVQRQKEIGHFKPEPYWLLTTTYRGCVFQAEEGKYTDKAEATKALSLVERETFYIDGITQKKSAEAPPQLYDLTSLQVDCNKRYGYTAETTLKTIQSLYEKKLTTYPRVDTRYLSDDIYQKCPRIIQNLSSRYKEAIPLLSSPFRNTLFGYLLAENRSIINIRY